MQTEKFQPFLFELLQQKGGIYTTPNDLELILMPDSTFYLGCKYPTINMYGSPPVQLEVNREFADYADFVSTFPIEHLSDLDSLTPEELFKLYKVGQMWINATLDEPGCFWGINFRIINETTYITDTETEKSIVYSGLLSALQEIIFFSKKYMQTYPPILDRGMACKIRTEVSYSSINCPD